MSNDPIRIVPLGGLGEFGMNCMVIERGDDAIMVDCGIMFPEDHMMGIDRVIPDLEYVRGLRDRFKGYVLTHGHEDHLGALPFALADIDAPVYASPFTAGLLDRKLEEHPEAAGARIEVFEPGDRFDVGGFEVETIPMTHSIVEACSLVIRSGGQTIIHTGDFKIDPTPVDGRLCGLDRLREIGDEGVDLLMSDSTNVELEGFSGSESEVRGYLRPAFEETAGRIFVTTFASHIHRLAAIVSLCEEFGRRLVIVGRSMEANASLATRTGHLRIPGQMLLSPKQANSVPAGELCYLVTGSQGEPRSALMRISMLERPSIVPRHGDAVVFSSKVIPGNEKSVGAIVDQLCRLDVEVYYPRIAKLHVSGHAYRDELKTMLELTRPKNFLPVHGQYRNLDRHARLAVETGVAPERCFRMLDGDVLELDAEGARRAASVHCGRILVDGDVVGGIDERVLRDRRHISKDGIVVIILSVSHKEGVLAAPPDVIARGLAAFGEDDADLDPLRDLVVRKVASMSPDAVRDREELTEEVRVAVRRYFKRGSDGRPVVVPCVMEL